jgi:tetratricopeptide (TPR) repeat protein
MFVIRLLLALAALGACAASLISARATHLFNIGTVLSLTAAVRLVPFNAGYVAALGQAQPSRAADFWTRSAELNPFSADTWFRLGYHAELNQHQPRLAEQYFLKAVAVDRSYLPRWTLANFYFRQHNREQSLKWAKSALEITPYDGAAVFFQTLALTNDETQVLNILPARTQVVFDYLNFLLASNRDAALEPVVMRALDLPTAAPFGRPDLPGRWQNLLGITEDRLLTAGNVDAALHVWNRMHQRGWTKLAAPSASAPLTNAKFKAPFSNHGFDWSSVPAPGVSFDQISESQKIRFTFSGTQPEWCRLLQQFVSLEPGRTYRMTWETESSDFVDQIGLTWKLYPAGAGLDAGSALSSPDLIQKGANYGEWVFSVRNDAKLYLITLEFKRPLGQVRAEGSLAIRDVSMAPSAALPGAAFRKVSE